MTQPESTHDIGPYLNPDYWNGHTLGCGKSQDVPGVSAQFGDNRFARDALLYRLRSSSVVPLRTFYAGDVFDPAAHEPGTTVLFREDMLYGRSVLAEYSLEELGSQEVPVRPTETSPSFGANAPKIRAYDKDRGFLSGVRWGVVPRHNDSLYVSVISSAEVFASGAGVRVPGTFANRNAPITVGETVHRSPIKDSELLRRVNILHVVAYGMLEQQRRRVSTVLGEAT